MDHRNEFPNRDTETTRRILAKSAGLPQDATWDQIIDFRAENSRRALAIAAGLSQDAGWDEIGTDKAYAVRKMIAQSCWDEVK